MTSPTTDSCPDPIATAEAFAAAFAPSGYRLDFSLRSLELEVDRVLSLPLFRHSRKDPTREQGRNEAALTAYLGESLRRNFGGRWCGAFNPEVPCVNFFVWIEFGRFRLYPWASVHAVLSEGSHAVGAFGDRLPYILADIRRACHSAVQ